MNTEELIVMLTRIISEQEATMAQLVAEKPAVTDKHSDGKRVRYVKAETTAALARQIREELGK